MDAYLRAGRPSRGNFSPRGRRAASFSQFPAATMGFAVGLVAWALSSAACSSNSSTPGRDGGRDIPISSGGSGGGSGGGGGVSTASGGAPVGGGGGAGLPGSGGSPSGSGGAQTDGGTPDSSLDGGFACGADGGGGVSGDCCPDDLNKTEPGVCGCGVADTDVDVDGVPDCKDACTADSMKTAPGICGCGVADTDGDGDGTPDCNDLCPQDRARTMPGPCGCGIADNTPLCLVHRYSFNDRGTAPATTTTTVADSVGGANGTAVGVTLNGTGSVALAGGTSDQYIKLPGGIISSIGDSATIEAWVTWSGMGGLWQRIFDFGNSEAGEGMQGLGQTFLFCSPQGGGGVLLVSMLTATSAATEVPGAAILTPATMQHVAVVVDYGSAGDGGTPTRTLRLYLNGALQMQAPLTHHLSAVRDVNNWLGRSQYLLDPEFAGTYHEFRIYSAARTNAQIMASFQAGPDALPAQ